MSEASPFVNKSRVLDGRFIYVSDEIFEENFVAIFYELLKKLPFELSEYDTLETKARLHLKHEFALQSNFSVVVQFDPSQYQ